MFDYAGQTFEDVPACPVCGRENPPEASADRYGFRIQIGRCRCGVEYLAERMTRAGYQRFYAEAYRPLVWTLTHPKLPYNEAQDRRELHHLQAHDTAKWLHQWGTHLPRWGRLLDVGGSTGMLARAVQQAYGYQDAVVLDPSADELAHAQGRGLMTVQGFAEDCPDLGMFDGILCSQTLDHLADPIAVLRWLRGSVAPKGWLYVDIVDAVQWARRTRRAQIVHKIDHLVQWSPGALRLALQKTGWKGIKQSKAVKGSTKYGVLCVPA